MLDVVLVTTRPGDLLREWIGGVREHEPERPWQLVVVDRSEDAGAGAFTKAIEATSALRTWTVAAKDAQMPQDRTLAVGGYRAGWEWLQNIGTSGQGRYCMFVREDCLPSVGWSETVAGLEDSVVLAPFIEPNGERRRIDPAIVCATHTTWHMLAKIAGDDNPIPANLRVGGPVEGELVAADELGKRVARAAMVVRSREEHREHWNVTGAYRNGLDRLVYEEADL